jgi:MFS-type transporter involved in bile tolerance (Atg22 family)
MDHMKRGNRYITLAIVTALAEPVVSALRNRISHDVADFLCGMLVGLAIIFLAAGARSKKLASE